jgi:hypothetical protein
LGEITVSELRQRAEQVSGYLLLLNQKGKAKCWPIVSGILTGRIDSCIDSVRAINHNSISDGDLPGDENYITAID